MKNVGDDMAHVYKIIIMSQKNEVTEADKSKQL